ncbi:fibronectin type III domain-containing protein [Cellulomonas sp. SLBN-39]|uniref:fibronectin type III domain-containing protein n=1 Tax=Cellulomonas sp. SLBN-39 TaxID=2768446 RepID=UPI0011513214|nr:fibronectin type III domain-containing protein [Cellulomonas sp. SLBN-39]TQL03019.1 fibronectin type III domain protein [Cellulomonas sp. SLBN-39]
MPVAPQHRSAPPSGTSTARRWTGAAATVVLALLAVLVPTAAQAATPGGSSRATAVPLPVADLDSSFEASNAGVTSGPGTDGQTWYNVTWYSWTPAEDVRVFIRATSTDPVGWDNTLEVWSGGSQLGQNDDFYGLDASLTVNLQGGTTYQIGLGGYRSSSKGTVEMRFATRVPSPPLDVQATRGSGSATVSWSTPADVAGGVTQYRVLCTPDGGSQTTCATLNGTPPSTSTVVNGLQNGTAYTFHVVAANVIGDSDPSVPVTDVVPQGPSTTTLSLDPAAPVSGEPFDVRVEVASAGAPVAGTVDVTVGSTSYDDLPLVGGTAVVEDVTRLAGDVRVEASFGGTVAVTASSASLDVTVAKRPQTVTVEALPDDLVYAGEPVQLAGTSSAGLPLTFVAAGSCSVRGTLLDLVDVGTCTVTASQAGDAQTLPGEATTTAEVGRRSQQVTFGELPALVYGQASVAVSASSSVGLPVVLTGSGACTVTGGRLVVTDVGTCTVTATQDGDVRTTQASAVVRVGEVARRAQTVTIASFPAPTLGQPTPDVVARSQYDLPVTLEAAGACVIEDGALVAISAGECTVTATSVGDRLTLPASASVTVQVSGPPGDVDATLDGTLGERAAGAEVSARGVGLLPGSILTLTVYSTPRVIGTAVVGADGTAVVSGALPPGLETGAHRLVATGTAFDGTPAEFVLTFTLAADGSFVQIADTRLPRPASGTPLAETGVGDALAPTFALGGAWVLLGVALLLVARRRGARAAR